jgi:acetyl/propionyl-CoA carboxylase alpha subunit
LPSPGRIDRLELIRVESGSTLERPCVEGVKTTVPFLRLVFASDPFRQGRVHTQMVDPGALNG